MSAPTPLDDPRVPPAEPEARPRPDRGWRGAAAGETAAVAGLALAVRLRGIAHEPWGDELYHILSAQQYLDSGVFGINGGVYERGRVYSELVAALYRVFGVDPVVARLPALIAGVLTIALLFFWVRRSGERLAAWVAAVLLIFTPDLIEQAQYARFYTLQHLFLLVAAVALYQLLAEPRGSAARTSTLCVTGGMGLALAMYFQPLTAIGAAGLALGAAILLVPGFVARLTRPQRVLLVAGTAATLLVVFVLIRDAEIVRRVAARAAYSDLWAEGTRTEIRFYHWQLLDNYATAWTLFPVFAMLALARQRRLATLALAVFTLGFVTHTLMAWKAARYILYLLPFFAVIVGLAVAQAIPLVASAVAALAPGRTRSAAFVRGLAWAGAIGFLVVTNGAFMQSARRLMRDQSVLYPGGPTPTLSWQLAASTLRPLASEASAVVSTEDLEAIWFLNRLDYVLDRDHLPRNTESAEFWLDRRVMARTIGETASLQRVMECHPSGLLIAMRWALASYKMKPETADFIVQTLAPVPLPERTGLVAFRWSRPAGAGDDRECSE